MTKKQAPQGHHGTDATPDRGRKFCTRIQEVPMAGAETPRGRFGYGKGRIEDGIKHDKDVIRGKR